MSEEKNTFYAHTNGSPDPKDWQPLKEHLKNTARQAMPLIFLTCRFTSNIVTNHNAGLAGTPNEKSVLPIAFQGEVGTLFFTSFRTGDLLCNARTTRMFQQ
jgi:hypothetical protein